MPTDGELEWRVYSGETTDEASAAYQADANIALEHGYRTARMRWDTTQPRPTLVVGYAHSRSTERRDRFSAIAIGITLLIVFVIADVGSDGRYSTDRSVDRPDAGFSLRLPSGWEHASSVEAEPGDWWDEDKVEDVVAFHEEFIAGGGVHLARTIGPPHAFCTVYDLTELAAEPPAWIDVEDARPFYEFLRTDTEVRSVEVAFPEVPAGPVLRADILREDGAIGRSYMFTDGERWFEFGCWTDEGPPADRWSSVADSFMFLSADEQ